MIRQILVLLTAAVTGAGAAAQGGAKSTAPVKEVKFLEGIEVGFSTEAAPPKGQKSVPAGNSAGSSPVSQTTISRQPAAGANSVRTNNHSASAAAIEQAGSLHLKFAVLLNVEVEEVPDLPLMLLIDDWWGTRYRMGGNDRSGIDCSGFTCMLYSNFFGMQLPRTSREQYQLSRDVPPSELRQGDLVFFTHGGAISHVGFYLQNNKFVHASTSEGVTISDLNDGYWKARYAGAGRVN